MLNNSKEAQQDLDHLGIPKNAREEKRQARNMSRTEEEHLARLYRQTVLKEKEEPDSELVQIS
jgi:hypothetical protein